MPNLTRFQAMGNKITNFEPLLELKKLSTAWITNNPTLLENNDNNLQKAKELFYKINNVDDNQNTSNNKNNKLNSDNSSNSNDNTGINNQNNNHTLGDNQPEKNNTLSQKSSDSNNQESNNSSKKLTLN